MNKAAFLDRDGTLIRDEGYLSDPGKVALLPGVPEALKRLRDAGYLIIVVTNQSGIARGFFTHDDVHRVQARLEALLCEDGVAIDGHYYCPHGPGDGCDCRKPAPAMLLRAAKEHGIDLAQSFMAGDKPSDGQAGQAAGCEANFLIGAGASSDPSLRHATSLAEVVEHFLTGAEE